MLQKHNAWQENKFSNVTVFTSEILHSRTLHWDVGFLVFCGITSFLQQISLSVTPVIAHPDFASVNRPTNTD